MGTLKIGSASNRKGVTINPSKVLFNGNNVRYIKSGATEIWNCIKPLIPSMTSNNTPYGVVSASSYTDQALVPHHAFDGVQSTGWSAKSQQTNNYIQYVFDSIKYVENITIRTSYSVTSYNRNMKLYVLNQNDEWVLDSEHNISFNNASINIELKNKGYVKGIRLFFADTMFISAQWGNIISEVQAYGY